REWASWTSHDRALHGELRPARKACPVPVRLLRAPQVRVLRRAHVRTQHEQASPVATVLSDWRARNLGIIHPGIPRHNHAQGKDRAREAPNVSSSPASSCASVDAEAVSTTYDHDQGSHGIAWRPDQYRRRTHHRLRTPW